jgi:hypothetical protein
MTSRPILEQHLIKGLLELGEHLHHLLLMKPEGLLTF